MAKITGKTIVLAGKYNRLDPANLEKTEVHNFAFTGRECLNKDGTLTTFWADDGYVLVGEAHIEIDLLPTKDVTTHAVATLRKQKENMLAAAQAAATQIEGRIQSLLAIEHSA